MPISLNSLKAPLAAALLALFLLLVPASSANATWTVKGGGFGHGIGMSAYGAYGMSKQGLSSKRIVRHYYRGIQIKKLQAKRKVRVLLDVDSSPRFSGIRGACGRKLSPSRTYSASAGRNGVVLKRGNGRPLARCGQRLQTSIDGRVNLKGLGQYRGGIEIVKEGGSLYVINAVPVNDYCKGVLAKEMIPSWPIESLKAFAYAVRSIGLSSKGSGGSFDVYPDTRSQVYGGVAAEYERTNRACSLTASRVLTYKGQIATAVFSASSGGHTENVENVWFGEPIPYLKGVKDPYDDVSPYHRWSYDFSNSAIASALGVKGRLKRVKITQYGVSKRVIWARFYGTRGMTKVRGDTLQYALGLPDRLVFSIRKSGNRTSASSPAPRSQPRPAKPGGSGYLVPGMGTTLPSTLPSTAPAATSDG